MQQRQFPFDPLKRNFFKNPPPLPKEDGKYNSECHFLFLPKCLSWGYSCLVHVKEQCLFPKNRKETDLYFHLLAETSVTGRCRFSRSHQILSLYSLHSKKTQWIFDEKSYFSFFASSFNLSWCLYPSTVAVPSLLAFHSVNFLSFLLLMFYIMIICQNCYCLNDKSSLLQSSIAGHFLSNMDVTYGCKTSLA